MEAIPCHAVISILGISKTVFRMDAAFSRDAAVGGIHISLPVFSLSLHKAFQVGILALKAVGGKNLQSSGEGMGSFLVIEKLLVFCFPQENSPNYRICFHIKHT